MSEAAALRYEPARPAGGVSTRRLGGSVLALIGFLGGFVLFEPAPYELFLVGVMALWVLGGLIFNPRAAALIGLMLTFAVANLISGIQVLPDTDVAIYIAVTVFLCLSAIFFALTVSLDIHYRLKLLLSGYVLAAVVTAAAGITGYLSLLPGTAELFTLYGRAKGAFADPNVYGPFLVLPVILMFRTAITAPAKTALPALAVFGFLFIGLFFSFSRAAWALTLFCLAMTGLIVFIQEKSAVKRLWLLVTAFSGLILAIVAVAAAILLNEDIASLFAERFRLVQNYDGGVGGRFYNIQFGYQLALEKPFGLGPYQFGIIYHEDPHNTPLNTLMAYGWMGFAAYIAIQLLSIKKGAGLLLLDRPWTPVMQCIYVAFLGHALLSQIIDTDHWRHWYLLLGLLWAGIVHEESRRAKLGMRPL